MRTTRPPKRLPSWYQIVSLIRLAISTASTASARFSLCVAVSVPAVISSGALGIGMPNCSASTQTNRTT